MEKGHLPWHIYSSLFHFPLQHKKIEENESVLLRIQNFKHVLRWLISQYIEVSFKCFEELHPCNWYVFDYEEFRANMKNRFYSIDEDSFMLQNYQKEKLKLFEKYKKT
jgi:hypothetical protein